MVKEGDRQFCEHMRRLEVSFNYRISSTFGPQSANVINALVSDSTISSGAMEMNKMFGETLPLTIGMRAVVPDTRQSCFRTSFPRLIGSH